MNPTLRLDLDMIKKKKFHQILGWEQKSKNKPLPQLDLGHEHFFSNKCEIRNEKIRMNPLPRLDVDMGKTFSNRFVIRNKK